jgi:hypothetical protein
MMRPISQCRDGLAFCLACVERQVGMPEQVALLLADVYGMSDHESAGRLRMPLSGFARLLDVARIRMSQHAGGRCALVGIPPQDAPDADNPGAGRSSDSGELAEQPAQWKIDEDRLRSLRRELLDGLGL